MKKDQMLMIAEAIYKTFPGLDFYSSMVEDLGGDEYKAEFSAIVPNGFRTTISAQGRFGAFMPEPETTDKEITGKILTCTQDIKELFHTIFPGGRFGDYGNWNEKYMLVLGWNKNGASTSFVIKIAEETIELRATTSNKELDFITDRVHKGGLMFKVVRQSEKDKKETHKTVQNLLTDNDQALEFFYLIFDKRFYSFTGIEYDGDKSKGVDIRGKSKTGQLVNIFVNPAANAVAVYPLPAIHCDILKKRVKDFGGYDVNVFEAKEDPFGAKEKVIGYMLKDLRDKPELRRKLYETIYPDSVYSNTNFSDGNITDLIGSQRETGEFRRIAVEEKTNKITFRNEQKIPLETIKEAVTVQGFDIAIFELASLKESDEELPEHLYGSDLEKVMRWVYPDSKYRGSEKISEGVTRVFLTDYYGNQQYFTLNNRKRLIGVPHDFSVQELTELSIRLNDARFPCQIERLKPTESVAPKQTEPRVKVYKPEPITERATNLNFSTFEQAQAFFNAMFPDGEYVSLNDNKEQMATFAASIKLSYVLTGYQTIRRREIQNMQIGVNKDANVLIIPEQFYPGDVFTRLKNKGYHDIEVRSE